MLVKVDVLSKLTTYTQVRTQVLKATNMLMTVVWDVTLYSLVDKDRRFRGAYCPIIMALTKEAANTSETSVYTYQTTRRNISEESHFLATGTMQCI
jgi:hypothetical protein